MADGGELEDSGLLLEVSTAPNTLGQTHTVHIITEREGDGPGEGHVSEDILQQALVEAEEFDQTTVEYASRHAVDDASVAQEIVNNVVSEADMVTSTAEAVVADAAFDNNSYAIVGTVPDGGGEVIDLEENVTRVVVTSESDVQQLHQEQINVVQEIQEHPLPPAPSAPPGSLSVTLVPANQASGATLGSSQNPIRIIQQGNQYTPVQQLTAEQLQQIMQVVQQQQLAKSTSEGGGSSILFNPQTNTRIVYRVIYPSELHKSSGSVMHGRQTLSQGQQTSLLNSLQRKPYRKRTREDEDDKVDGPELSKEEKEERKKHRPRTRSGRVSKPPKHMVKDYKHIHVLDWDEDYDDSDGGYSDYKCSDEEGRERGNKEDMDNLEIHPGLGSTRPKNYKCETCEKAYIGRAGLGRHYRLYPSHGTLPDVDPDEEKAVNRTNGSLGSISEDSNTQDSIPSTGAPSPAVPKTHHSLGRGRHRGRYAHLRENPLLRRKSKLREIVRLCEDEELMEVVLPRLANVITLWEFLLMKVERGSPSKPHVDDIYYEFEALHKQVQRVCQTYLQPAASSQSNMADSNMLQLDNSPIAQSLGLVAGSYEVKDMPLEEGNTFQYKYLTTEPVVPQVKSNSVRRTIEVVTPDQLVSQHVGKRPRMTSLLPSTTPVSTSSGTMSFTVQGMQVKVNSVPESLAGATTKVETKPKSSVKKQPVCVVVDTAKSQEIPKIQAATSLSPVLTNNVGDCFIAMETDDSGMDNLVPQTSSVLTVVQPVTADSGVTTDVATVLNGSSVTGTLLVNGSTRDVCAKSVSSAVEMPIVSKPLDIQRPVSQSQPLEIPEMQTGQVVTNEGTLSEPVVMQLNGIAQMSNEGESAQGVIAINTVNDEVEGQVVGEDGQIISTEQGHVVTQDQIVTHSNIFQTEDGILIIQNPDGTTFQLQGAEGIPLETVQALLAMESEGQFEGEQVQAELQQ